MGFDEDDVCDHLVPTERLKVATSVGLMCARFNCHLELCDHSNLQTSRRVKHLRTGNTAEISEKNEQTTPGLSFLVLI